MSSKGSILARIGPKMGGRLIARLIFRLILAVPMPIAVWHRLFTLGLTLGFGVDQRRLP